jgi:hypothetical protein
MTLPLPALALPKAVRCLNPLCQRWLRDPVSIGMGYGPTCAHDRGLTPPRAPRRGRVVAADTQPNLLDLIKKESAMGYNICDHDYTPRFGGPRPKIVTLCGSTRFKEEFLDAMRAETLAGKLVIPVGLWGHSEGLDVGTDEAPSEVKVMLDELHLRKIDVADEILVVSDKSGYYGTSTRREIAYAEKTGKRVRYLVDETVAA